MGFVISRSPVRIRSSAPVFRDVTRAERRAIDSWQPDGNHSAPRRACRSAARGAHSVSWQLALRDEAKIRDWFGSPSIATGDQGPRRRLRGASVRISKGFQVSPRHRSCEDLERTQAERGRHAPCLTYLPMAGLVTEQEASNILGLSARTLQKWRLQGNGPRFVKLGHAVRYDPVELDRYIDGARRRSTSDAGPDQAKDRQLRRRA